MQKEGETVGDFILRIERAFRVAYGSDKMGKEAKEAIKFGQLQEGLRLELMRSPAVSGAMSYQELMMAALTEEQRQKELQKRKKYQATPPSAKPASKS